MLSNAANTGWSRRFLIALLALIVAGCQPLANHSKELVGKPSAKENSSPKNMMQAVLYKAGFSAPTAIAFDKAGNMFVANWSGGGVVKIDATGNASTYAAIAGSPAGLAFDSQGFLYVSDYRDAIYRVAPDGTTTVFAKGLHTPTGINFNHKGELLATNRSSNEVVKISPTGEISVIAKGFHTPVGVVEHPDGNIYVSNYSGGISKIDKNGSVTNVSTDFGAPGCGIIIFQGEVLAVDNGQGMVKNIGTKGHQTRVIAQNLKQPVALGVHPQGKIYVGTWGDGSVHLLE